jgi:hypothetical protein
VYENLWLRKLFSHKEGMKEEIEKYVNNKKKGKDIPVTGRGGP